MTTNEEFPLVLYRVRAATDLLDPTAWMITIHAQRALKAAKVYKLKNREQVRIADVMVVKTATTEVSPSRYTYCFEKDIDAAKAAVSASLREHALLWAQRFTEMVSVLDNTQPKLHLRDEDEL